MGQVSVVPSRRIRVHRRDRRRRTVVDRRRFQIGVRHREADERLQGAVSVTTVRLRREIRSAESDRCVDLRGGEGELEEERNASASVEEG